MVITAAVCAALFAVGLNLQVCTQERGQLRGLLQSPERYGFSAGELNGDARWRVEKLFGQESEMVPCETAVSLNSFSFFISHVSIFWH